jgi:hypothetical protein
MNDIEQSQDYVFLIAKPNVRQKSIFWWRLCGLGPGYWITEGRTVGDSLDPTNHDDQSLMIGRDIKSDTGFSQLEIGAFLSNCSSSTECCDLLLLPAPPPDF